MSDLELLTRLVTALAIGMLVGLERGWQERAVEAGAGSKIAGTRTFGIVALLGAVTAMLSGERLLLLGFVFVGLALLLTVAHVLAVRADQDFGITTVIAALATYVLGAAALRGPLVVPAAVAVVMVSVLSLKPRLHWLEQHLEARELRGTFQLLLISIVILPVLPDRGFGPWQALNPYELWWMVVLIASISYVGYFGIKLAGSSRGLLLTGLLGGLASSTAVTLDFARMGRHRPNLVPQLAAGILVASATMFPRMLLVAGVIHPPTAVALAPPLLAMAATLYAWGLYQLRSIGHDDTELSQELRNPFELRTALTFTLILAVVMLASRALLHWLGTPGVFLLAGLSGASDVDAITISLSGMGANGQLLSATAAQAVTLTAVVNTLVKGTIAGVLGGTRLGRPVGLAVATAVLAGALAVIAGT